MEKHKIICRRSSRSKDKSMYIRVSKAICILGILSLYCFILQPKILAAGITIDLGTEGSDGSMGSLELLFIFTLLALAPSILIMMTSFTRIVIVFSFLRTAIGIQQTPPNQVVVGLALFLSLFIMQPVFEEIHEISIEPYMNKEISQEQALELMQNPLKEFMYKHTNPADFNLFLTLSGEEEKLTTISEENLLELGLEIVVPAFITSELKRAFTIGFLLFLPFLVIDMVVSSTLMSMGMMMLPPTMIALPFKLMLFVVVDGWRLIMEMLIRGFR